MRPPSTTSPARASGIGRCVFSSGRAPEQLHLRRRGSGLDAAHHTQTSRVSGTRGVTIRLSGWYKFLAILPLAHRVRRATRAHLSHPAPATKCGIFPADRNPLSPELRLSDPRPASTLCGCWQTEVAADAMVDSQATSTNRTLDLGSAHLRAEVSYGGVHDSTMG